MTHVGYTTNSCPFLFLIMDAAAKSSPSNVLQRYTGTEPIIDVRLDESDSKSSISSDKDVSSARKKIREATAIGGRIMEETKLADRLEMLMQKKGDQLDLLSRKKKLVRDQLKGIPRGTDKQAKDYKVLSARAKQLLAGAEEEVRRAVATLDREITVTRCQLESVRLTPTKHKIEELDWLCNELKERSAAAKDKEKDPATRELRQIDKYLRKAVEGGQAIDDPIPAEKQFKGRLEASSASCTVTSGDLKRQLKETAPINGGNQQKPGPEDNTRAFAKELTTFVMDWMIGEGDMRHLEEQEAAEGDREVGPVVPKTFSHERELEICVLPRRLDSAAFRNAADEPAADTPAGRLASAVADIASVQHLHSLALSHILHLLRSTRRMVAGFSPAGDEVSAIIEKSTETILLASDPDLKQLPFQRACQFEQFLCSANRIEKLGIFIMTYVAYGKQFVSDLLNLLMSPGLQSQVYWSGSSKRQGREYLPAVVEVFLVRVARSMHLLAETGREFDEAEFVKEARSLLHNTERNLKKRHLATNVQVAGKTKANTGAAPAKKRARVAQESDSLYSFAVGKLKAGFGCKADLVAGIKKAAMASSEDDVAAEIVGRFLDAVRGSNTIAAVQEYVAQEKPNLEKIPFHY